MYIKEFLILLKVFLLTFKENFNAENDVRLHSLITCVIFLQYHQFENEAGEKCVNYIINVVVAWQFLK